MRAHRYCTELATAIKQCTTPTVTRISGAAAAMRKVEAPATVSLSCTVQLLISCLCEYLENCLGSGDLVL